MRTVIPVYFKMYPQQATVNPVYDVVDFLNFWFMFCAQITFFHGQLTIMPPFTPNEHMLKTQAHRSPTKEPWEIFAECVRDAMCVHGGFIKDNTSQRDKLTYENLMERRVDSIELDGVQYSYSKNNQWSVNKSNYEKMDSEAQK